MQFKKIIYSTFLIVGFSLFVISANAQESFTNKLPFDLSLTDPLVAPAPSTLSVTNITTDSVSLSWTQNTDSDFKEYRLYRITVSSGFPSTDLIAVISNQSQISFTDTNLPAGIYDYYLDTYNLANLSSRSNQVRAVLPFYVPFATITVDGNISDWQNIAPAIIDKIGDKFGIYSGTDISRVYLARDDTYLYLRIDLADGPPNPDFIGCHTNLSKNPELAANDYYQVSSYFTDQWRNFLYHLLSISPWQSQYVYDDLAGVGAYSLEMRTLLAYLNDPIILNISAMDNLGQQGFDWTPWVETKFAPAKILPAKAVELTKEVIGKNYWYELYNTFTKGWKDGRFVSSSEIIGLDCSGLSFWSYNRAFYEDRTINWKQCVKNKECPVAQEGADGQYRYNSYEITKQELKLGDLLFFDTEKDPYNTIDHVAMYIGGNEVIHAEGKLFEKIVKENLDKVLSRYSAYFKGFGRAKDAKISELYFIAKSPVNLAITDPDGIKIASEILEVPGMYRHVIDVDDDGDLEEIIEVPERKIGDYSVNVVPKPDALPTDTYTFKIESLVNGETETATLAENVPVSDIPRVPYVVKSTETEIISVIPTFVDFQPDTLNFKSKGQDVTVYIELPKGYNIHQIDLATLKLNDQISPRLKPIEFGDHDHNGIPDLMIKFDRKVVQNALITGEVKITVSGKLNDGRPLEGSDTIRVINTSATAFLMPLILLLGFIGCCTKIRHLRKNKRHSNKGKITLTAILIISIGSLVGGVIIYRQLMTKEEVTTEKIKEEVTITDYEITDWRTYRNVNQDFEIRYPQKWSRVIRLDEKETSYPRFEAVFGTTTGLWIKINIFGEVTLAFPPMPYCERTEEFIVLGKDKLPSNFVSTFQKGINKEECDKHLLDTHLIYSRLCIDRELKAYPAEIRRIGEYMLLCKEGDNLYDFQLNCEGKDWQGEEGRDKCSQLFNQIISTFKFIK